MSTPSLARSERAALCDLLEEVGPHAPTLCEGWDTTDLAAHLVVRERRPDSGPGLVVGALAGWTERVRTRAKDRGYATLVDQVRSGPPLYSPFVLFDSAANSTEYFIHHEDVRRARPGWQPRDLGPEVEDQLWNRLRSGARLMLRRSPVGVELRRPDGASFVARAGSPVVTVSGPPGELTMFLSGRKEAARVELEGEPDAVARLRQASFGL